jgi:PAS domain S-box-containing protein
MLAMLEKLAPSTIAENEFPAAELLFQLLSCSLPDAICFKDVRRRYICLNDVEGRFLGVAAPQSLFGKTADRLLTAKRARLWRQEEAEVLVTGMPLIDRVEKIEHQDGTVQWLSATKTPIRNPQGNVVGLVAITRDITNYKLVEQLKDQFVSTISHELRTPVTSILGSLALVASGAAGSMPEPTRGLLEIARTNSQRLLHLINDILDLEKIETGMMVFDLERVDVRRLVEHEIASIHSFAEPYGVTVRLDPLAATGAVLADPRRLAQVVSNLLSNAVKFSPSGEEVVVGIENHPGRIRICVRDHGPGIPEALRHRIFDKFVQVKRTQARQKGSGLGLSIVKEIVERMKGVVDFEPAPGGGTVFYVTFPCCDEATMASPLTH